MKWEIKYTVDRLRKDTYNVDQEVPADNIILDQMGCDVCGCVRCKGHQEVRPCYCQGATCGES